MWAVMMVAMMVPTTAPITLMYAAVARKGRRLSTNRWPRSAWAIPARVAAPHLHGHGRQQPRSGCSGLPDEGSEAPSSGRAADRDLSPPITPFKNAV